MTIRERGALARMGIAALGLWACAGSARADLECWPEPLAQKGEVRIQMCVDALNERMLVVSNDSRGLIALPVISGCALTFADGKRKIARWKAAPIAPRGESRERAPLAKLPEPVEAVCEIEKVTMMLEGEAASASSGVGSRVSARGSEAKIQGRPKKTAPALIIKPVLHPELAIEGVDDSGVSEGQGLPVE